MEKSIRRIRDVRSKESFLPGGHGNIKSAWCIVRLSDCLCVGVQVPKMSAEEYLC